MAKSKRNPPWAEEELILALDLYLRSGLLGSENPSVEELSAVLNRLTIHSERPDPERFRNPNGVALKLANFASIDPNHRGLGMRRHGKRDTDVWNRYALDEDTLAVTAAAIREGRWRQAASITEPPRVDVREVEIEAQHVEQFRISRPGQDTTATRREQDLVLDYADHLKRQGHRVKRSSYQLPGFTRPLFSDLVDKTDNVLYEAKGDVLRSSVRMAIGQLLDYRRFEPPSRRLAILLPREPIQDLIELIHSVPATAVWRTNNGFESVPPSAASAKGPGGDEVPE